MIWVVLAATLVYFIANLPLLYSLRRVHGWEGTRWLWAYAPNQFLFLVVVFPFAALYTFLALRVLVVDVRTAIPLGDPARWILEHWSAWLVGGLGLVSVITLVVYFGSAMSLDKLRPIFVSLARNAINEMDRRSEKLPENERAAKRATLIRMARDEAASESPPLSDDETSIAAWLEQRPPEVVMQVLMNPKDQLRLRLLDPTIHSLNVFQLLMGMFVGATALTCTLLALHAARVLGFPGSAMPSLSEVAKLLSVAIFCFALYPLMYHEFRSQMQEFVGQGFTVLQDTLTAGVILIVMMLLNSLRPTDQFLSLESVAKYLPVLLITGGFAAGQFAPAIWRQLVGRETTWGIQVIVSLLFSLGAFFPMLPFLSGRR